MGVRVQLETWLHASKVQNILLHPSLHQRLPKLGVGSCSASWPCSLGPSLLCAYLPRCSHPLTPSPAPVLPAPPDSAAARACPCVPFCAAALCPHPPDPSCAANRDSPRTPGVPGGVFLCLCSPPSLRGAPRPSLTASALERARGAGAAAGAGSPKPRRGASPAGSLFSPF